MKKKTLSVLAAFLLCLLAVLPAFAAEGEDGFSGEYFRVMDMADLLGENEEEALLEKLDEISVRQEFEVAIATTDTLEGSTAKEYADDLFEYCDFGYGEGRDGVLLLVSLEDRDWWISTHGYGITAFTDAGIKYLSGRFLDELSEGNYAAAFGIYAEQCDAFRPGVCRGGCLSSASSGSSGAGCGKKNRKRNDGISGQRHAGRRKKQGREGDGEEYKEICG